MAKPDVPRAAFDAALTYAQDHGIVWVTEETLELLLQAAFKAAPTPERMLREFHASKRIHDGLMPDKPTAWIPDWVRQLRWDLLTEEMEELGDADAAGDIVKFADAIADVVYVLVGTAVVHGIPFDAVFAEVHRSNMTKHNTPAEAKLVKGPDYEPPDIAGVLGIEAATDA